MLRVSPTSTVVVVMSIAVIVVLALVALRVTTREPLLTRQQAEESISDEMISAYSKAADTIRAKTNGSDTAPFSPSRVHSEGDGMYRIDIPWEGMSVNGKPATRIAECYMHCDSGLCYVDSVKMQ